MSQEKPSYIDYWFLFMAGKVLEKNPEPSSAALELTQAVYNSRERLGLNFPEAYKEKVFLSDKAAQKGVDPDDVVTVNKIRKNIEIVRECIKARLAVCKHGECPKGDIERNIELMFTALKMSKLEGKLLMFFACMPKGRFQILLDNLYKGVATEEDYAEALGFLLNEKPDDIKEALRPSSTLVGMQFIGVTGKVGQGASHHLEKGIKPVMENNYKSADELLEEMLGPQPRTELTAENFAYMGAEFDEIVGTIEGYLSSPHSRRKNMSFAGPPGSGKTEGAAVVAKILRVKAFLVGAAKKKEGAGYSMEEPTREDRVKATIRAAFIVRQTKMKVILIADEAEDFLRDLNREETKETGSKAFINEMLETLHVPIIFISNRMDLFDPATVRRILPFYHISYMPLMERSKSVQGKIRQYMQVDVSLADAERIAENARNLTIAIIDTCIQCVAQRMKGEKNAELVKAAVTQEIVRAITASNSGYSPLPYEQQGVLPEGFEPALISANKDVRRLVQRFRQAVEKGAAPAGLDILILGPPGSGRKTLANYFALAMGRRAVTMPFDIQTAFKEPDFVHALDLRHAGMDGRVAVLEGADLFYKIANGHPFFKRMRGHSLPTIMLADLPPDEELIQSLSRNFTLCVKTGPLSDFQLALATKTIAGVEYKGAAVPTTLKKVTIGDVVRAARQIRMIGGDMNDFVEALDSPKDMAQEQNKSQMGFRPQSNDAGFNLVAANSNSGASIRPPHV
jgi:hypothetical protein